MIPTNPIPEVPNYGSSAQYKDLPSPEQIRAGVIPLDSLPAAWWNAMWACTNTAVNDARSAVGTLINEICNAITGAGICINESCIDQLYQAIDTIRQRIGNAVTAGAVKSSSCCGEVSIDANGIMTANGVGNAAQLNTTSKVVVSAINELKSTYDCCISDLSGCISGVDNSKAPTSHVSSATTYGVGNADCYGHLKISDTYSSCVGAAADGVAASQKALYCVYCAISAAASLGNTAGCALGTASAGTATTAARSDHVHPTQTCIPYTGTGYSSVTAYQDYCSYCGSPASEWASYLIFNHQNGGTYYSQMIRMSFSGIPQYQRKTNGTDSGWKTFITSENISSQSVNYATSAGSATNACCAKCLIDGGTSFPFTSNYCNDGSCVYAYVLNTMDAASCRNIGRIKSNILRVGMADYADSAGVSTCAYRTCVLSNAWCASQTTQSSWTIKNCCTFPILAFATYGCCSFMTYLAASGTTSICLPSGFSTSVRCGLRVF